MTRKSTDAPASEPLFEFDRKSREALLPYKDTPAVRAIGFASQAADQMPLRIIAGATFALGLVRRDTRMALAGLRMLVAHEAATMAKDAVKRRVIRSRPRSASKGGEKPRKGRDTRKEESSFPSGHSAGAFAVAQAFAASYPRQRGKARAAAAAVSLARIPGCAHYPSDVGAGAAIGAVAAALVNAVWRRAIAADRGR